MMRYLFWVLGLALAVVFIAIMTLVLDEDGAIADMLFNRSREIYPFTIQNAMWLLFGVGLADVALRLFEGINQRRQINIGLLPEDSETMLRAEDLGAFAAKAQRSQPRPGAFFLQELVLRVIFQFQSGRSVAQANEILNSSLELRHHEVGLRYSLLRYLVWLIPTLGFIGTVVGISAALNTAGSPPDVTDPGEMRIWMQLLTSDLGVAFNTTLVALILSAVLVFLIHIAEEREEGALNLSGQYCLDNLINRLYER